MISVVIVNWNSGPFLEKCVLSLLQHASGCEIIVVDNASDDLSLEAVLKLDAPIKFLKNKTNAGFAAGSNQGWRQSRGDQVLFLNPDTESKQDAITRLAQALIRDPRTWAVAGKLVGPSGEHQVGFNLRAFPTIASVAADMLLLDEIWPRNPWTSRYRMWNSDETSARQVDQPAAACLLVQRSVLERLGGFDESFRPAWFEDVDLCRRIWNNGGRIIFEPAAEFLHHGGSSLRRLSPPQFLEYFHTNQLRYFYKHHGAAYGSRVRKLLITGMYLRAMASFVHPLVPHPTRAASVKTYWRTARYFALNREAGR